MGAHKRSREMKVILFPCKVAENVWPAAEGWLEKGFTHTVRIMIGCSRAGASLNECREGRAGPLKDGQKQGGPRLVRIIGMISAQWEASNAETARSRRAEIGIRLDDTH